MRRCPSPSIPTLSRLVRAGSPCYAPPMPTPALQRPADVIVRLVAGQTVLVPVTGQVGRLGEIYLLNDVAARVWELLDGSRNLESIVDAVQAEFEAPEERIRTDVLAFLEDLRAHALLSADRGCGT